MREPRPHQQPVRSWLRSPQALIVVTILGATSALLTLTVPAARRPPAAVALLIISALCWATVLVRARHLHRQQVLRDSRLQRLQRLSRTATRAHTEESPMLEHHNRRRVELLYVAGCPHHTVFLPHLRSLLDEAGVAAPIELVEVSSEAEANRLRFLGSPSLRIDGVDVEPGADTRHDYGLQCRLYLTDHGVQGTPTDHSIQHALRGQG